MAKQAPTRPPVEPDPNQGVLMGGLEPQVSPSPAQAVEPDLADNWEELLLQPDDNAASAAAPTDGSPDPEPAPATEPPTEDPQRKLELENAQLKAVLTTHLQQQQQQAAPVEEAEQTLDDRVKAVFTKHGYPEVPPETLGLFKDLLGDVMPSFVEPLQTKLDTVTQAVQANRGEQAATAFDAGLKAAMDEAGLSDAEIALFKPAVTLQGIQRWGNQFDLPKATQLFQQLHGAYQKDGVDRRQQYAQDKQQTAANAPPRTERGANAASVADLAQHFAKSPKKEDDFGGSRWRKYIQGRTRRGTS